MDLLVASAVGWLLAGPPGSGADDSYLFRYALEARVLELETDVLAIRSPGFRRQAEGRLTSRVSVGVRSSTHLNVHRRVISSALQRMENSSNLQEVNISEGLEARGFFDLDGSYEGTPATSGEPGFPQSYIATIYAYLTRPPGLPDEPLRIGETWHTTIENEVEFGGRELMRTKEWTWTLEHTDLHGDARIAHLSWKYESTAVGTEEAFSLDEAGHGTVAFDMDGQWPIEAASEIVHTSCSGGGCDETYLRWSSVFRNVGAE